MPITIKDSTYLDIAKLRMAGRIDLTAWKSDAERYISFSKAKGTFQTILNSSLAAMMF
jgi:nucleoid-associated protein